MRGVSEWCDVSEKRRVGETAVETAGLRKSANINIYIYIYYTHLNCHLVSEIHQDHNLPF